MKKCILFLESEPDARKEFESAHFDTRNDWELSFASNPAETLALADLHPFDAFVVLDIRLPLSQQVELLNELGQRQPKAIRFMRFGPEDKEILRTCRRPTPHYLPKHGDADSVKDAIKRAFQVDDWQHQEPLKKLMSQMRLAPSLPVLYQQIIQQLQSPHSSLETTAQLIANDPLVCAKMLQLVNSAFFGLPRHVSNAFEAVMFLGSDQVKALILYTHFVSQFDTAQCPAFGIDQLWHHSMATASFSRWITQEETANSTLADEVFTAGLLHDVGKLLLAANLPKPYQQAILLASRNRTSVREAELQVFGAAHDELGACLLGIWGLPMTILESVAWHHTPALGSQKMFTPLAAVHIANALAHEHDGHPPEQPVSQVDMAYLDSIGLSYRCEHWRKICGCPPK